MSNLKQLDDDLNQMILTGKALDGFEKYYADHCVMQENTDEPTVGKDANRQREIDFFDSVAELHDAKIVSSGIGDGVTFAEWILDVTFKQGGRKKLEQTAVRKWEGDQIVHERFYYNAG